MAFGEDIVLRMLTFDIAPLLPDRIIVLLERCQKSVYWSPCKGYDLGCFEFPLGLIPVFLPVIWECVAC